MDLGSEALADNACLIQRLMQQHLLWPRGAHVERIQFGSSGCRHGLVPEDSQEVLVQKLARRIQFAAESGKVTPAGIEVLELRSLQRVELSPVRASLVFPKNRL